MWHSRSNMTESCAGNWRRSMIWRCNWHFGSSAGRCTMKKYCNRLVGYGVAALVLAVCCAFTQQKQKEEETEVAVIVNPANPVEAISLADLRKIFAGEKQSWGSPGPISLFVRGPGAREREVLLSRVLKLNEPEYQQHWDRKD